MALDVLTQATVKVQVGWNVSKNQSGLAGLNSTNSFLKALSYALGVGAGQVNEIYSTILSVTGSGTSTLVLSSFTDVVNQATIAFARVKMALVYILGTGDTYNGVTGTVCTGVSIGNAGSHPWKFCLDAGTDLITIAANQGFMFWANDATGATVTSGTYDQWLFTNNDSVNTAKILVALFGGTT